MKTITLVTLIFLGRMADAAFAPENGCMMVGLKVRGFEGPTFTEKNDQACNDECVKQDNSESCKNGLGACCEGWSLVTNHNDCNLLREIDRPYQFVGKGKGVTSWVKDTCESLKREMTIDVKMPHCFREGGFSGGVKRIGILEFRGFSQSESVSHCQHLCHSQEFPHDDKYYCNASTFKMTFDIDGTVAAITAECIFYQYTEDRITFDDDKSAVAGRKVCSGGAKKEVKLSFGPDRASKTKNKNKRIEPNMLF